MELRSDYSRVFYFLSALQREFGCPAHTFLGTWLGGGRWREFTGKGRWQKCCPIASTLHRSSSEIPLLFEGGGSRLFPWQPWRNKDLKKVWGKLSCHCPRVWPCHGQWLGMPAWRKDTGMVIKRAHSRNDCNKHSTTDWLLPGWFF